MFFILFFASAWLAASEKIPGSLHNKLAATVDVTEQIKINIELGNFYEDINFDSAYFFFNRAYGLALSEQNAAKDKEKQRSFALLRAHALRNHTYIHSYHGYPEKAIELGEELIELAESLSDTLSLVSAHISLGNTFNYLGRYPLAVEHYQKALDHSRASNDNLHTAKALQNLGIVHYYMGNLIKAATFTHEALNLYSEMKNQLGEASCLLTMGNVISEQEDFNGALNYYNQAYLSFEELNHTIGKYNSILNVGAILIAQNRNQEAVVRFEQALEMAREINDLQGIVRCLHNLGMGYSRLGSPELALQYYQQALGTSRVNNFRHLEANTLSNMAGVNNDLRQYGLALNQATEGLMLAQQIQSLDDQLHAYRNISRAHEGLGDFRKALEYHKLFKFFTDSLHRIETRREVSRIEAIYQTEQMQQEMELKNALLEKQNLELAQQSASLSRQRLLRNVLLLGVISLAIIAGAIYWNLWRRKKLSNLIMSQKGEIEIINQTLVRQNSEIGCQRDEITRQKGIIEEKNAALVSSIHYAKSIQNALLPDETLLAESFKEHFLIYEPKEIVSGDFFWVNRQNGTTLLAVADSTGHGVPGAFMSMLGISFLNEFVARHKYLTPAQLLDEMRLYIISSLHQQGTPGDQQDGIELALVAFDHNNENVIFSGARTPIFIATQGEIDLNGKHLKAPAENLLKIKADQMPLAFHKKMKPFSNHTLKLNPGDILYLMSDGFADQFGYQSGERFTSQRLISFLGKIQNLPLPTQKEKLLELFNNWKKDAEQVDDITVIGVKV